ncbi:MAG: hypothetical protein ACRDJH_10120 [Thermomicrobiales bacterium]
MPSSPARADWQAYGATFGYVASKQATIFGYKLHLLVTLGGVIRLLGVPDWLYIMRLAFN